MMSSSLLKPLGKLIVRSNAPTVPTAPSAASTVATEQPGANQNDPSLGEKILYHGLVFCILLSYVLVALKHRIVPQIDDSAIYYRYITLFAHGHGIVYNIGGPHVYGCSCILYVLVMATLVRCGVDIINASYVVNLAGTCFASYLLFGLVYRSIQNKRLHLLAAVTSTAFALFQARALIWSMQGMECALHLALLVSVVWAFERQKPNVCGLLLGLAIISKLDAIALAIPVLAIGFMVDRKSTKLTIYSMLVVFIPWMCWSSWYFGSSLPSSFRAKELHEYTTAGHTFIRAYLSCWPILTMAISSAVLLRTRLGTTMLSFLISYILLYDFATKHSGFPWYFYVSDFILWALAGLLPVLILDRIIDRIGTSPRQRVTTTAVISILAIGLVLYCAIRMDVSRIARQSRWLIEGSRHIELDRTRVGRFIANFSSKGEILSSGHGWPQYLSHLTIYDPTGINDPYYLQQPRMRKRRPAPQYIVDEVPKVNIDNLHARHKLIAEWDASFAKTSKVWALWALPSSSIGTRFANTKLPLQNPI